MWDYFSMIFWVAIAAIGMFLYANPSMIPVRMYEGFTTATPASSTTTATAATRPAPAVNTMLRNLEQLLGTPGYTPDARPTMPQEAPAAPGHVSNTGRQQPEHSDAGRIASRPQPVNTPPAPSAALAQGQAFTQSLPVVRERIVEVPVPRTCPSSNCPTCPDMRDYIRKDSIPCWACKL